MSGEALGRMDKLLAEHFGVDTTTAGCIIVAVLAVVWFVRQNSGPSDPPPTVELHPKHLEYIRAKEAVYCKSNNEGKAILDPVHNERALRAGRSPRDSPRRWTRRRARRAQRPSGR